MERLNLRMASLKVQRGNIETTGHLNLHTICTQTIDKRNQQLKFKKWDVNKLFERISEGPELESCPIQNFFIFLFHDHTVVD